MADLLNKISDRTAAEYDRLREDCGSIELSDLSLIGLTGEDRKGWLQGQVTNDVRGLEPGNSSSFCFCSVTGQLQAVVDAWAISDRVVMTTARGAAPEVYRRVEQMVVLEDVVAQPAAGYRLVSVQGPMATRRLAELMSLPKLDAGESRIGAEPVLCFRSDRTGSGGWDVWVAAEAHGMIAELERVFPPIGADAYQIARLEAGIPAFGADYSSSTFPKELGPAFEAKHVSYQKGCYMGQEILMRMHSRGHANRTWVGLVANEPFEVGALVRHPRRPDAGVVTSTAYSPEYGHIAGAMLRREAAEPGECVRVSASGGEIEAEVRQMPLLRFD